MTATPVSTSPTPHLRTVKASYYRDLDKAAVFGGAAQALMLHRGLPKAVMLPIKEFERLLKYVPDGVATIGRNVAASVLGQTAGNELLEVKAGTEILGVTLHSNLRAVFLPYPLWEQMKQAAGESIPDDDDSATAVP